MNSISININTYSETLRFKTDLRVQLPLDMTAAPGKKHYQTLYLFHGGHGDEADFLQYTGIAQFAAQHQLALVMPSCNNSFYQDMHFGSPYYTYIRDELPQLCQRLFPLSDLREDTFTCGVSMGGYAALRLALDRPEHYCAAISLSGALDFPSGMYESIHKLVANPFKPYSLAEDPLSVTGSESDLLALAQSLFRNARPKPALYLRTGRQDEFCHHMNLSFMAGIQGLDLPVDYKENDEKHSWDFWSACMDEALQWLPLKA